MKTHLIGALVIASTPTCFAQESPTLPAASAIPSAAESAEPWPTATESPTETEAPIPTATASASATAIATPSRARSVRISFLPPPLEGKISLGIYDLNGQLVRVLHKEAGFDQFTVGADALITKWDGKDDEGKDRPAGKYHARGFLVDGLKVEEAGAISEPPLEASATGTVQLKLMPNPLTKNAEAIVDLTVAFDEKSLFLRTADGLPLFTVGQKTNLSRAWIKKNGEKTADIFVDENGTITQLRVSNVDKMMAFDCGAFDLN